MRLVPRRGWRLRSADHGASASRSPATVTRPAPRRRHQHAPGPEGPGRHEVDGDEPQRQQADVVEAALRVDRGRHRRGDAQHRDGDAEAAPRDDGRDEPDPGQDERPGVRLAEVLGPALHVRVAHRRRVRVLQPEGDQPPTREQQADGDGRARPPQRAGPRHRQPPWGRRARRAAPSRRCPSGPASSSTTVRTTAPPSAYMPGTMCESTHAGEHDRGPAAVPPLPDRTGEEPEEQHGQRQAERKGVLPGQRREEVPAVNGEGVVEQERQGGGGQKGGERGPQAEEPAAGPGADRQHDRTEDRPQLERHAVGDDPTADGDEEIGNREVEGVEREAVVPARIPSRQVAVAHQGLEELRHRDVGAGVAAGRRRVRQQHARVQLRQRDDNDAGDRDHRDGARHPPPAAPGRGPGLRRGRGGLRGSLRDHGLGPDDFSHVRPEASRRGARCPSNHGRAATSAYVIGPIFA